MFKVGDKVRIKGDVGSFSKEILTVTGIYGPGISGWPIHTTAPEGERSPWRWKEDELELVEEVTDFDVNEMFDAYKSAGVDISVTIDGKVYTGTVYPSSKNEDWGSLHGYDEFGERV